jgi:heme o synthase
VADTLVKARVAPSTIATLSLYLNLTKPRVIELLLVITVPSMILANGGLPAAHLIVFVLVGGALAAGGANTLNCWIERDRDVAMVRTAHRPLPSGLIDPRFALTFGLALEVAAFCLLWAMVSLLAAILAVSATIFYVFVYTIWLKPRSDQNIVVGGAAGAVPVLVGWAAVTGTLATPAWVLFAVVFLWTPPHFWALAIRYRDDYAAAGFPMLPVTKGTRAATVQILAYTGAVIACSYLLAVVAPVGAVYLVTATLLGAGFLAAALALRLRPSPAHALRFFRISNLYLAVLFLAVAVDTLVG